MTRLAAVAFSGGVACLWVSGLALPGCRGKGDAAADAALVDAPSPVSPVSRSEVDPMAFFVVFQGEVEAILRREGENCEGAFAELRRLVADRRADFFKAVAAHDSAGGTPALLPTDATERLMRFAGLCPVQAAKLNDLVYQLVQ